MKRIVFVVLLCMWSLAFGGSCDWLYYENKAPIQLATATQELCFDTFVVLYALDRKTPIWSAERLTKATLDAGKDIKRNDSFHQEAQLEKQYRVKTSDYLNSDYDKGHLTPYRNNPLSPHINSLANTIPQAYVLNRGKWAMLEDSLRDRVMETGNTLFIITGAVFFGTQSYIGNFVPIPTHMYKVVVDEATKKKFAYLAANTNTATIDEISISDLERSVGVIFFQH